MAKNFNRDCAVGDTIICDGPCSVTILEKTGRKARLLIESDAPIHFSTKAQECHESLGDDHGTNRLRGK